MYCKALNKGIKMSKKIKLPSIFTFMRSIEPGLGIFYALDEHGKKSIITKEVNKLRATFSGQKAAISGEKDSSGLAKGNIHIVESAFMPHGSEKLEVAFSVKVLSNSVKTYASNNMDVSKQFTNFVDLYSAAGGINYIAGEYIKAIFRGDFLWRNKSSLTETEITITLNGESYTHPIVDFNDDIPESLQSIVSILTVPFASALTDKKKSLSMHVSAVGYLEEGMQVFPSQEFTENKSDKAASRVLVTAKHKEGQAVIFTAEKIGNALRRVDTWYEEDAKYPLPVEPLGIDRDMDTARRHKDKTDFYSLVKDKMIDIMEEMKEGKISSEANFIFACLVRGGLFNGEPEKDKKAKAA
jgi:CRISPR-associated protein Csy3